MPSLTVDSPEYAALTDGASIYWIPETGRELDIERAEKLLLTLERAGERHDQADWIIAGYGDPANPCGATACAAGWAVINEGLADVAKERMLPASNGHMPSFSVVAAYVLGLNQDEAGDLFVTCNSATSSRQFLAKLIATAKTKQSASK